MITKKILISYTTLEGGIIFEKENYYWIIFRGCVIGSYVTSFWA